MQQSPVVASVGPGAGIAIGPGIDLPVSPWALAPDVGIDLDFVNDRGFNMASLPASSTSFITTSRASVGYADDSAGTWFSFTNNVARRTNKGLLVEEARTNLITNNSGTGAVAGATRTPVTITGLSRTASATAVASAAGHNNVVGDLVVVSGASIADYNGIFVVSAISAGVSFSYVTKTSTTDSATGASYTARGRGTPPTGWFSPDPVTGVGISIVGTGTESGIDYVDVQIAGVTTGGSNFAIQMGGASSLSTAAYTASFFCKLVGGSNANHTHQLLYFESGGSGGTSDGLAFVPGSAALGTQRISVSHTVTGTGTTITMSDNVGSWGTGVQINGTYRYGWQQSELGAFATSPIRTTAGAVTRAADAITLTTPPAFGNAVSLYMQGTPQGTKVSQFYIGLYAGDGTNANHAQVYRSNGGVLDGIGVITVASVPHSFDPGTVWTTRASAKEMIAVANNDQSFVFSGGTASTGSNSWTVVPTVVYIGAEPIGNQFDGFVEHIGIWPTMRVSNARMQSITT